MTEAGERMLNELRTAFPNLSITQFTELLSRLKPEDIKVVRRMLPNLFKERLSSVEKIKDTFNAAAKVVRIYRQIQKAMVAANIDKEEVRTVFRRCGVCVFSAYDLLLGRAHSVQAWDPHTSRVFGMESVRSRGQVPDGRWSQTDVAALY